MALLAGVVVATFVTIVIKVFGLIIIFSADGWLNRFLMAVGIVDGSLMVRFAKDRTDEMLDQPWFPVEPNDVFPEEFSTYLRSPRIVGEVFDEVHPEIATVDFWQGMKDGHEGGRRPDFFPYPRQYRFPDD